MTFVAGCLQRPKVKPTDKTDGIFLIYSNRTDPSLDYVSLGNEKMPLSAKATSLAWGSRPRRQAYVLRYQLAMQIITLPFEELV